jgi:hypothetical protein
MSDPTTRGSTTPTGLPTDPTGPPTEPPTDGPADGPVQPSEAMRALDRLVGTWRVTGGAPGTVRYAWMEGGHFLLQHLELEQDGEPIRGLEVIGHLRPYGEGPSADVHSRYYDSAGATLDYVYEMDGDTLHIWMGTKGSPARFSGTFTDGDTVMVGGWEYPGGGGYPSTMTRVTS